MTIQRIQSGWTGEQVAVVFLKSKGYTIVEQNFKNKIGEIDIIATDQKTLCFIEVKTRHSDILGSPLEAVTKTKQKKITRVALSYLQWKGIPEGDMRFDVVGIRLSGEKADHIELIKNAFECC